MLFPNIFLFFANLIPASYNPKFLVEGILPIAKSKVSNLSEYYLSFILNLI